MFSFEQWSHHLCMIFMSSKALSAALGRFYAIVSPSLDDWMFSVQWHKEIWMALAKIMHFKKPKKRVCNTSILFPSKISYCLMRQLNRGWSGQGAILWYFFSGYGQTQKYQVLTFTKCYWLLQNADWTSKVVKPTDSSHLSPLNRLSVFIVQIEMLNRAVLQHFHMQKLYNLSGWFWGFESTVVLSNRGTY